MKPKQHFPNEIFGQIKKEKILGICAGSDSTHRVIGLWVVVVDGRVFVRSWSMKPNSWWRTFLQAPYGGIFVSKRKRGIKVRAVQVRSEKLKEAVSAGYREKYNTPGSIGYVEDMSRKPSLDTTTGLIVAWNPESHLLHHSNCGHQNYLPIKTSAQMNRKPCAS